jgi:NIMA (never in mitosis gene a)-related kinase
MATLRNPFVAYDLNTLYRKIQSGVYEALPSTYSHDLADIIQSLLTVSTTSRATSE